LRLVACLDQEYQLEPEHVMKLVASPLACVGLVVLFPGCGQPPPPSFKVSGIVTFQGKPLDHGTVLFHSSAGAAPIKAELRQDGTFDLSAVAGDYKVTVASTTPGHGIEGVDRDYQPPTLQTPAKYIRLDETPLTATVQSNHENVVHLPLAP
jgi:hypothetical protein